LKKALVGNRNLQKKSCSTAVLKFMKAKENKQCPLPEIDAYIDGELSKQEEFLLEQHLANCPICFRELNEQKSLFCILDSALKENFTKENYLTDLPDLSKSFIVCSESTVNGLKDWGFLYKIIFFLLLIPVCLHNEFGHSISDLLLIFVSFLWITYESLSNFMFGLSVILRVSISETLRNVLFLLTVFLIFILVSAFVKKSLSLNR
jgi:hypothetical protein